MTHYYQETDSKIIFALPHEIKTSSDIPLYNLESLYPEEYVCVSDHISEYLIPDIPSLETLGRKLYQHYSIIPEESSVVGSAWNTVNICEVIETVAEAKNVLSTIYQMIFTFKQFNFDIGYLPPLKAFNLEDGSVLIEWIYPDFRVGFSIEENKKESGWYLVSNKKLGEISASGFLESIDINRLVLWLLNFVISNS